MSNGREGPSASRAGVPHTVPPGTRVHDAFPPFPPTKKKKKKKKKKGSLFLAISKSYYQVLRSKFQLFPGLLQRNGARSVALRDYIYVFVQWSRTKEQQRTTCSELALMCSGDRIPRLRLGLFPSIVYPECKFGC